MFVCHVYVCVCVNIFAFTYVFTKAQYGFCIAIEYIGLL